MAMLRVSDNQRYLVHEDGRPFFYLADTAWELFHRLTRQEAETYLRDRAAKGYTAIQAVALAEMDGLTLPNAYGHLPLHDSDPTKPDEGYFQDVDWVVELCNRLGMWMALLPTWGDKWNKKWGKGPEVFTPENARAYGRFLGQRYRDRDVIWIVGGDRPVENDGHRAIVRAMADGLREGDGGRHLITFHPSGLSSSSKFVHDEPWLDFNMFQSGHGAYFIPNWKMIERDRGLTPVKPTLDGEPCYENHPVSFNRRNPPFNEYHVRCAAYWAVFAGAFGHTYGCHDIWCFATPDWQPVPTLLSNWQASLKLPGAAQMGHVRRLIESRPQLTRIPDAANTGGQFESEHHAATRDGSEGAEARDATYLMVYTPITRNGMEINTRALRGDHMKVWLFNPRSGEATLIEETQNGGSYNARVQVDDGPDWVFVLDAADAGYAAPGERLEPGR